MTGFQNMRWLFWKEYRQNRKIVFTTLLLLVTPYVLVSFSEWRWGFNPFRWRIVGEQAAMFGLSLLAFALTLIGGSLVAGERADRSAEFQAYLPIPRRRLWGAKLCLPLAVAAAFWFLNLPVFCCCCAGVPDIYLPMALYVVVQLAFFSCAWLLSSVLRSPVIAVSGGLVIPLLGLWILALIEIYFPAAHHFQVGLITSLMFAFVLPGSLLCFAIGSWIFLRRVEP